MSWRPASLSGADRHDQRIDDNILARNAEIGGAFDNFLGDGETHVRIFGNAGFVVGNSNHGTIIFLHQRQNAFKALFFASHGIQQWLALIGGNASFERLDDGAVDRERHGDIFLHELDAFGENARLVGQRNTGIDVKHLRARRDLRQRVIQHAGIIAARHFLGHDLAAGGIVALANHDETALIADHHFNCPSDVITVSTMF